MDRYYHLYGLVVMVFWPGVFCWHVVCSDALLRCNVAYAFISNWLTRHAGAFLFPPSTTSRSSKRNHAPPANQPSRATKGYTLHPEGRDTARGRTLEPRDGTLHG
jgi:hypothetical protein